MPRKKQPAGPTVLARLKKADDLEIHILAHRVESALVPENRRNEMFVDIREYVPSLESYGRGILIPEFLAAQFADEIDLVVDSLGKEAGG